MHYDAFSCANDLIGRQNSAERQILKALLIGAI